MKKIFRQVYLINLIIIIIGILTPIVKFLFDRSYLDKIIIGYYAVFTLLSITFCLTFLVMNLYGLLKDKQHRRRYLITTILLFIWIIWGTYQIFNGYYQNIVL